MCIRDSPSTAKSSVKVKAAIIGPISPSEKITMDRKVDSSRLPESQNAKPQGSTQISTEGRMASVSYTHLDVYKRQVDDEKHLLHSIFGTALHTQIVNDKQIIFVKTGDKLCPVLRLSLIHI